MEETILKDLLLSNGHKVNVQTSTRQVKEGEKSTFISINTGCFRIRIVQRNPSDNSVPPDATIGFSTTSETDNLADIKTLALSLEEAIKLAEQLNKKVTAKEAHDVNSKLVGQ